jgi:hypothetical protein
VRGAICGGKFLCRFQPTTDNRGNLYTIDQFQSIKVFFAKGATAGKTDFHGVNSVPCLM